jgi:von Willebrand factor type A domain
MRRGPARLRRLLVCVAFALGGAGLLAQGPASLQVASAPTLVDCMGQACFRLLVNALDADGQPIGISNADEIKVFETGAGDRPLPVFFRHLETISGEGAAKRPGRQTASSARPRYALLVVDTSGTMSETIPGTGESKFDASIAAIRETFLANFEEGTDHMAIVGFDSRRVRERILSVPFTTSRAEVEAQLGTLRHNPKGNTGLYSAASFALDKIKSLTASDEVKNAQILLVIFTDGANDVGHPSDDPGLLAGEEGLELVSAKATTIARQLPMSIVTIGLGSGTKTYDEASLQRLKFPAEAPNYHDAQNRADLERIFSRERIAQLNRIYLTFGPVRPSKDQLTRPVQFKVALGTISTQSPRFEPPALGLPTFAGVLNDAERSAFETGAPADITKGGTIATLLQRFFVLGAYAALLAVLWFGIPRLIWPERYVPRPSYKATAAPARAPARPTAPARGGAQKSVTISSRAPARPTQSVAAPAAPSRIREGGAQPGRDRPSPDRHGGDRAAGPGGSRVPGQPPSAPSRTREPGARPPRESFQRGAGDATVFIPPKKSDE